MGLGLAWGGRAGQGGGGHNDVGSYGDHAQKTGTIAFLPLYTTYCRRMFDVSATRRTVTRVHAFCAHAKTLVVTEFLPACTTCNADCTRTV